LGSVLRRRNGLGLIPAVAQQAPDCVAPEVEDASERPLDQEDMRGLPRRPERFGVLDEVAETPQGTEFLLFTRIDMVKSTLGDRCTDLGRWLLLMKARRVRSHALWGEVAPDERRSLGPGASLQPLVLG